MASELPREVIGETSLPLYGPRAALDPVVPTAGRTPSVNPESAVRSYARSLRAHSVPPERMVPLLREYIVALLPAKVYLEHSAEFISLGIRAYYESDD